MLFRKRKYKVGMRGRSGVVYEENKKTMHISAEMLAGEIDLVIYFDSIKCWLPPHENDTISPEEKNTIKANVTEELEEKGLVVEWE